MNEREFARRFPNASRSTIKANCAIPDAEPQREHEQTALVGEKSRKEECMDRVVVSFKGFRVRPLDPDNFAGSIKGLLDGLRHAHLIRGDEPWRIRLQTEQVKVKSFAEERTEIEIIYPELKQDLTT